MSFGNSGDFFHGSTTDGVMLSVTATAKMPNWLSDSFPIRNIVFRQANEANNVNVHYVYEDYSGFEGRTVPTNGAFHFTLPMMPLAASEDGGILPTRITGFRIIGECNRNVRATMVRTLSGWNSDPKIADRSGDRMQSMDGWVNTPNTYAGRLHSLSFMIHDDTEETEYIRRPFFSGVEIGYEVIVGRSA